MAAPVVVRFAVEGLDGVRNALRSVEDAFVRTDKRTEDSSRRTARARLTEEEKLSREKVRAAEKTEKELAAVAKRDEANAIRHSIAALRAFDKGENDKAAAAERWAKVRARIVDNSIAMEQRAAKKKADDEIREAKRAHDARVEMAKRLGSAAINGAQSGMSRVAGITGNIATTALGLGGGFSVADSMHRAMSLNTLATDIAIQGHVTNENGKAENRVQRSGKDVEGHIRAASTETGLEAEDVGKGLQKFTNLTGDLSLGLELLPQLAKMAAATGTSFDDMAQSAGNISKALEGTKDPAAGTVEVLKSMAGAGRENSIELKDFAVQVAKIAATAGKFEGGSVESIVKMSALMQGARGGGGAWNAASAATAVNSFGATFGKGARRKEFAKYGVKLDGEDGKVRDPFEIIADSIDKSHGKIEPLNAMYGSVMADRAIRKYVPTYNDAEKKQKGSGRAAVMEQMKGVAGAKLEDGEISSNLQMKMQTDAAQMGKVKAQFDKAISTDLLPQFTALIPVIKDMIPVFVDLAKTAVPKFAELITTIADFANANKGIIRDIAAHPVGAIMAAELVKSIGPAIASAGISDIFKKGLSNSFASGGLLIGTAALAIELGMLTIDKTYDKENRTKETIAADTAEAEGIQLRLSQGRGTPEDVTRGKELQKQLEADKAFQEDAMVNPGIVKSAGYLYGSVVSPAATQDAFDTENKAQQEGLEDTSKTLRDLTEALKKVTIAANKAADAHDNVAGKPPRAPQGPMSQREPDMSGGAPR